MKKNRIIAIVLAVALVGSLAGVSAFAASGNTQSTPAADTAAQKKDVQETAASHTSSETVYVIANADGSAQKVIVSQKYDADDANAAQEAQSTLTDPQNVKGDNCWQGTTDKALPVTVAITYTLDGKTVHHTLSVRNPGTEELRFGIGYHPAFNIPFDAAHTTTDYEFRFDQPESPVILDAYPNGLLNGKNYYRWKNQQAIPLTDDLFANDSFCMAGLRTKTVGIYEKDTGRHIVCNVEGYPYSLIWSAPAKSVRFVCIEPWQSLPGAEDDPQDWNQRAAAACLAPGEEWSTTLSTTFER